MAINKINIASTLVALLLLSCNSSKEKLPFYNTADFTAEWIKTDDVKYQQIHTIDTFTMHNQLGNIITKDSLDGFIYVTNFFFTICPSICPKMINNLHLLQDSFANNPQIKLVSFTVMPWVDSVARLKVYGENHNINPSKWYLLTGNKQRIYTLGRQSYFSEKRLGLQKDSTEFLHTESMLLIDKKGRIRGIYNATDKADIARVTSNIRTLLNE
ncbi:MAG: SCO family protein [Pedobacter sp.]|nr:SCO family protein [Chitinophagaceae bacterium]